MVMEHPLSSVWEVAREYKPIHVLRFLSFVLNRQENGGIVIGLLSIFRVVESGLGGLSSPFDPGPKGRV